MIAIEFQKNKIALEDLLVGIGTETQTRGTTPVNVTKINSANFPYDNTRSVSDVVDNLQLQIDNLPEVVDENGNMLTGLINTSALDLDLTGRLWRKTISSSLAEIYYGTELLFQYNPTSGNLVLDPVITGDMFKSDNLSGLTDYAAARTNLGLVIGTNVQAQNTLLSAHAALNATSGTIEKTGADTVGVYTVSTAGKALIDDADVTAQRTTLGLGTAAVLNVGTAANNIVQLDANAKMPAVDASQLTNVPLDSNSLDTALDTKLNFNKYFESAQLTWYYTGYTVALDHGLGARPKIIQAELICTSPEAGYSIGDSIPVNMHVSANLGAFSVWGSETQIGAGAPYGSTWNSRKDNSAFFQPSAANWKLILRAWA